MPLKTRSILAAAVLFASLNAPAAMAAADPAVTRAETFCQSMIEAVRQSNGKARLRAAKLTSVVEESLNTRVMAQFVTGAAWERMSEAERTAVIGALTRYSAARLAQEFDSFTGQSCAVDAAVQTRGVDKLVKSRILQPGEAPAALNYRIREYGAAWKIVDIYYDGVSQLATERADFAAVLRSGGPAALVRRLDEVSALAR